MKVHAGVIVVLVTLVLSSGCYALFGSREEPSFEGLACTEGDDCGFGLACIDGECVVLTGLSSCTDDSDCAAGAVCDTTASEDGECVPLPEPECDTDGHCRLIGNNSTPDGDLVVQIACTDGASCGVNGDTCVKDFAGETYCAVADGGGFSCIDDLSDGNTATVETAEGGTATVCVFNADVCIDGVCGAAQ
jgi:hypothetical protein